MNKDNNLTKNKKNKTNEKKDHSKELKIFSDRLYRLRVQRGYETMAALAKAYDNDERFETEQGILSAVKKWEAGKTLPGFVSLKNLCTLLECDPLYLFGELPEDCPTKEVADFKEKTGLSEETYKSLNSLKKKHDVVKKISNTVITELEVLESLINQKENSLLNSIWVRIARTYPKRDIEVHTPGNGWNVHPDDLRASDNMLLYNSMLDWIETYNDIYYEINSDGTEYSHEPHHKYP